jgi:hypothetical protein
LDVEDFSSSCKDTKSLYRLSTVQVRMGVETIVSVCLSTGDKRKGTPEGSHRPAHFVSCMSYEVSAEVSSEST